MNTVYYNILNRDKIPDFKEMVYEVTKLNTLFYDYDVYNIISKALISLNISEDEKF